MKRTHCGALMLVVFACALLFPHIVRAQATCDVLTIPPPSTPALYIAPSGNDNNPCTIASPCATLSRVSTLAAPGYTIYARGGVYYGQQTFNKSGTSSQWILITNYPNEAPVFDGNGGVGAWGSVVALFNASYVAFNGFEVRNTGYDQASQTGGYCLKLDQGNHAIASNNVVHDCAYHGIVFDSGAVNIAAISNVIYNASMLNSNAYCDPQGSSQPRCSWGGGLAPSGQSTVHNSCITFKNNTVHDTWGECVDTNHADTGFVTGNTVYNCFSVHIYLSDSKYITTDGNYIYDQNDNYVRWDVGGTRGVGIGMQKESNTGETFPAVGHVISNNIIDSVGEGIYYGFYGDQSANNYYQNLTVAHNTIIGERGNGIKFRPPPGGIFGTNYLDNNIVFKDVAGYSGSQALVFDTSSQASSWTKHNNDWPNGVPAGYNLDSTNKSYNPALVGPTLGQPSTYKLSTGSQAIASGSGEVHNQVPKDFWGVGRSSSAPSVGVDEHSSSGSGGGGGSGAHLFYDQFNRTTGLGSNWTTPHGTYTTDGTYAVSGTPPSNGNWAKVVPTISPSDYSVSANIIIPAGSLYSGLAARSQDASNFDSTLYAAQISTAGTVNLYRRNGWNWTQLSSVAAGIAANTSYALKLVVTGANPVHLEVWVNGAQQINYNDNSSQQITTGGQPGVENYDAGVKYTNFSVDNIHLFSDTFNRTTGLGSNWNVWHGGFTTDGTYAVSGAPPTNGNWASVVPNLGTNNYAVSADVFIPTNSLYSGVVARSADPNNFDSTLYAAQLSTAGTVNLYRRNSWTWTLLSSAATGITANTTYNLKLIATGSSPVHLEVWVNGSQQITYDDSSTGQISSGVSGMQNYDANVKYTNFAVDSR